jgi:uncharacterized membrane protein
MTERSIRAAAFGIGVVAGLRSLLAPATIVWTTQKRIVNQELPWAALITGPASKKLIKLALAELLADKLPFTPNRISLGPLASRLASGAACGASVSFLAKASAWEGALWGSAGALAGAFAGFYARRRLGKAHSDLSVALVEDAIAVALGIGIMRQVTAAMSSAHSAR